MNRIEISFCRWKLRPEGDCLKISNNLLIVEIEILRILIGWIIINFGNSVEWSCEIGYYMEERICDSA